jgi:hypothetical protein
MQHADILKTAIIMPFGLFEFLRLTFWLRNAGSTFQLLMDRVLAGSTFQRLMDRVLARLAFAFVYFDDIIIASPSMDSISWTLWKRFSSGCRQPAWSSISRSAPSPCPRWISWAIG